MTNLVFAVIDLQASRSVVRNEKLTMDGADGAGGVKFENPKGMLCGLQIEVHNSANTMLNEGVGADYVQKEKVVSRGFHFSAIGMRFTLLILVLQKDIATQLQPGTLLTGRTNI